MPDPETNAPPPDEDLERVVGYSKTLSTQLEQGWRNFCAMLFQRPAKILLRIAYFLGRNTPIFREMTALVELRATTSTFHECAEVSAEEIKRAVRGGLDTGMVTLFGNTVRLDESARALFENYWIICRYSSDPHEAVKAQSIRIPYIETLGRANDFLRAHGYKAAHFFVFLRLMCRDLPVGTFVGHTRNVNRHPNPAEYRIQMYRRDEGGEAVFYTVDAHALAPGDNCYERGQYMAPLQHLVIPDHNWTNGAPLC